MIRLFCFVVGFALAVEAQAGPITVITDSGNLGEFMLTNIGISGGVTTLEASVPNISSAISTVNGVIIPPEPTSVNGPITLLVTPNGGDEYSVMLSPGLYTQTVGGTVGMQAKLSFDLENGVSPTANFFNLSGIIESVLTNSNPLYDFSGFTPGTGDIHFALTATTFTNSDSFASLISTVGATATGNGSFSEAIPEPSSVILLGFGLISLGLVLFVKRK